MSKYNIGGSNIFNEKTREKLKSTVFFQGIVTSNTDVTDSGKIQARIKGIDDHVNDKELATAFPLLQKFFHVVPKVGEAVLILVPDTDNPYLDRVYIGPLVSQPQFLNKDLYTSKATSGFDSSFANPEPAPSTVPDNKGVYPNKNDVAIQGRDNSDIIFKAKEVLLRAGKFELNTQNGEIPKFNKKDPSYIQIKHNVTINKDTNEKGGVVNIVANKIHLLTHKDGQPRFILNNQDDMISQEELFKIMNDAHPVVFGDLLLEYLKLLRNAFTNHVHAWHGTKPEDLSGVNDIDKYLNFDLNSLLSKNILIN